jgi:hypothetical protein
MRVQHGIEGSVVGLGDLAVPVRQVAYPSVGVLVEHTAEVIESVTGDDPCGR